MAHGLQVRKHTVLVLVICLKGALAVGGKVSFSKNSRTLEILTNERLWFLYLLSRKDGFHKQRHLDKPFSTDA